MGDTYRAVPAASLLAKATGLIRAPLPSPEVTASFHRQAIEGVRFRRRQGLEPMSRMLCSAVSGAHGGGWRGGRRGERAPQHGAWCVGRGVEFTASLPHDWAPAPSACAHGCSGALDALIIPILQMGAPRHREVTRRVQGHPADKRQSWERLP